MIPSGPKRSQWSQWSQWSQPGTAVPAGAVARFPRERPECDSRGRFELTKSEALLRRGLHSFNRPSSGLSCAQKGPDFQCGRRDKATPRRYRWSAPQWRAMWRRWAACAIEAETCSDRSKIPPQGRLTAVRIPLKYAASLWSIDQRGRVRATHLICGRCRPLRRSGSSERGRVGQSQLRSARILKSLGWVGRLLFDKS